MRLAENADSSQIRGTARGDLSQDHRPAHVHAIGRGREAVFNLNCPLRHIELRENYGFSRREVRRIKGMLAENQGPLCEAWRCIHGDA